MITSINNNFGTGVDDSPGSGTDRNCVLLNSAWHRNDGRYSEYQRQLGSQQAHHAIQLLMVL